MLVTMDGNDSLKQILQRESVETPMDEEAGAPMVGVSTERPDSRKVGGSYYLTREVVDRRSTLHRSLPMLVSTLLKKRKKTLVKDTGQT